MDLLLIDEDTEFSNNLADEILDIDNFTIELVKTAKHAINHLKSRDFDFILVDAKVSGMDCISFIDFMQKTKLHFPIYVLAHDADPKLAVQCIKAGAEDIIQKPLSTTLLVEKFNNYTQTTVPWRRGYILNGYVLKDLISETLSSLVFTATKKDDPVLYAVKAIKLEEIEGNELAIKRFEREVEVIQKLNHPNIIRIYSFNFTEDNIPYMIMPFIKGLTLGEVMDDMTEAEFLDVLLSLLDTLWDVHKYNLIHRDLKPDNIMFFENRPILLDFGTVLARNDLEITCEGSVIGTPNYMAPETFKKKKLDYRADIYSLGIILYKYVYKKCPYDGKNFREIYDNLQTYTDEDLYHGSKYDELLKELIQKSPNDRHDSILTISEELMKIKMSLEAN
jgi:serine/threonine protein kinase